MFLLLYRVLLSLLGLTSPLKTFLIHFGLCILLLEALEDVCDSGIVDSIPFGEFRNGYLSLEYQDEFALHLNRGSFTDLLIFLYGHLRMILEDEFFLSFASVHSGERHPKF
jgi:hypothetical protein